MQIVFSSDEAKAERHSSIDQFKKYIATKVGEAYRPIVFDNLDYIDCDRVASHPIIIEFDDKIGYHFPVAVYHTVTNQYDFFDRQEELLRPLPAWAGNGFYKTYEEGEIGINFDNNTALSHRNDQELVVGLDYVTAVNVLPDSDRKDI